MASLTRWCEAPNLMPWLARWVTKRARAERSGRSRAKWYRPVVSDGLGMTSTGWISDRIGVFLSAESLAPLLPCSRI